MKDNMPSIELSVTAYGSIAEKDFLSGKVAMDELKAAAAKLAEKELTKSIEMAVHRVQKEYRSDVLGFGRTIHIENRDEWYSYIRKNWEEIYPEIPVSVTAHVDITDATLYQRPLSIEKEED